MVFSQVANRDHIFQARAWFDRHWFDKPESISWTEPMTSRVESLGRVQVSLASGAGAWCPRIASGEPRGEEVNAPPSFFPSSSPSPSLSQGRVDVGPCPSLGTGRGCPFEILILQMSPQSAFQPSVTQMCIRWGMGAHHPSSRAWSHSAGL